MKTGKNVVSSETMLADQPVLQDYQKLTNRYCSESDQSKAYPTLLSARLKCDQDNACGWVYDEFCNDVGFYICPKSSKIKVSDKTVRSCVYRKGKTNNYVIFSVISHSKSDFQNY